MLLLGSTAEKHNEGFVSTPATKAIAPLTPIGLNPLARSDMAIVLLEWLDRAGVTVRRGEARVLREDRLGRLGYAARG